LRIKKLIWSNNVIGMKTPRFETEEEAAEFWDTHSTADYMDEWEVVESVWDPDEDTCPRCGGQMESVSVEIDLFGKLKLHHLDEYVCPVCHTSKLSTRSLRRSEPWTTKSNAMVWRG